MAVSEAGNERSITSAEFFEEMYRRDRDPWNFAGSEYETRRYDATLAAIAGRRYGRAFEPGCSVGVLTQRLAAIADEVVACDVAETAVRQARERCAELGNVMVVCGGVEEVAAQGERDLVVLSEIGYYFSAADWARMVADVVERMPAGGTLVAVHWLGTSEDHRMSGDAVHAVLRAEERLTLEQEARYVGAEARESFRLDRFRRR
jgi:2-polyprenyl-3-methyl-5-hydroxy-6-metoxy-1,4-benzoquinol methylase